MQLIPQVKMTEARKRSLLLPPKIGPKKNGSVRTVPRLYACNQSPPSEDNFCCCGLNVWTVITGIALIFSSLMSLTQHRHCFNRNLSLLLMFICLGKMVTGSLLLSGGSTKNWRLVLYGSYSYAIVWVLLLFHFFSLHYICVLDDLNDFFTNHGGNKGASCLGMLLQTVLELTIVNCVIIAVVHKYGLRLKKKKMEAT